MVINEDIVDIFKRICKRNNLKMKGDEYCVNVFVFLFYIICIIYKVNLFEYLRI